MNAMKTLCAECGDLNQAAEIRKNGADEVILACQNQTFSAMHEYAPEEIMTFIDQAHSLNLRVSVLMNRLYGQNDIREAQSLLESFLENGADSICFADPGLFTRAAELHQEGKMIYEPETLITSSEDAAFWMEQGLASVVISPLITREEISMIAGKVPHASLIIHGRELMSVSKRHLLQAYADASDQNISFAYNRHMTMRENKREGHMPVYENRYGTMIYTDFIQESFDEMNLFMESGIERYLIEDAFIRKEAFLDAIKAYRKILNGENAGRIGEEYRKRYSDLPLSSGYYGQKTIR